MHCECSEGKYNNGSACVICGENCISCNSGSSCTICKDTYSNNGNGTCSCNETTYENNGQCINCSSPCYSCNENNCLTCEKSYLIPYGHICECPDGQYDNTTTCADCSSHCAICTNNSICLTCNQTFTNTNGTCECNSSQYLNSSICNNCPFPCTACTSANSCSDCSSPYVSHNGECICADSTYNTGETCAPCGANCNICNSASSCTTCDDTFINDENGNCSCPASQLLNSSGKCAQAYRYLKHSHITSLRFDSSFSTLDLSLSISLVQITLSDCSKFFINYWILGTNPTCTFSSSNTIKIYLGLMYTITNLVPLEFITSLITIDGEYSLTQESTINFNPTNNTAAGNPIVVITGPSSFSSSCNSDTFVYQSSLSTGNAIKTFTYNWDATSSDPNNLAFSSATLSSLKIKTSNSLESITITLTISNVFGGSATQTYFVTALGTDKILQISASPSLQNIYYSQDLLIHASIENLCTTSGILSFVWTLPDGSTSSGITHYQGSLNIPAKKLLPNSYNFTVQAILTFSTNSTLRSNIATSNITISSTPLVAILDKMNLQIPSNLTSFIISGSGSYDPDSKSTTLNYLWTANPSIGDLGTGNSITISNSYYAHLTSFTITLEVSANNGARASTISSAYTVLYISPAVIKFSYSGTKVALSTPLSITSTITLNPGVPSGIVSLLWSKISGPSTPSITGTNSFITIAANTLSASSFYTIQLAATISSQSTSSSVVIPTNAGAACTGPFNPSKSTGKKISTIINFSMNFCYDIDGQDYPLVYTFRYTVSGSSNFITLGVPTQSSSFNQIFISANTYYANILVRDALGDGQSYVFSACIITNSLTRNLQTENINDEYNNVIQMYDPIMVISGFLVGETVSIDLLDTMWTEFTKYADAQVKSLESLRVVTSIITLFMNNLQSISLTYTRLDKYTNYLKIFLSQIKIIDTEEESTILNIASRILEISNDMSHVLLSESLIETLFLFNNNPLSSALSQNTVQISIYRSENFINILSVSPIVLGGASVILGNLAIPEESLVDVKAIVYNSGVYADIISISITSTQSYANNELNQDIIIIPYDNNVEIKLRVNSHSNLDCAEYQSGRWELGTCDLLSIEEDIAIINVHHDGIYSLIPSEPGTAGLSIPFYIILALISIAIISIPFMNHIDKNLSYASVYPYSITGLGTDRSVKVHTESDYEEPAKRNRLYNHLFISLLMNKQFVARSKRMCLFIGNLVLEIFLQNYLLDNTLLTPEVAGIVSALPTMICSLFVNVLCRKTGTCSQITGILILVAMYTASITCMFFTVAHSGWGIALLLGFFSEILISQTLVMMAINALNI